MNARRLLTAGACAGLVLTCALVRGGILSDERFGDVSLYALQARRMLDGAVPYRDFFVEYPPGSLLAFLLPGLVSLAHYATLFKALMALFGAGTVLIVSLIAECLGYSLRRTAAILGAFVLAPFAVGPLIVNEYDLWPALLVAGALLALLGGRERLGCVLLGLGIATKIYPVAALPAVLVWIYLRSGPRAARRGLIAAFASVVAVYIVFVALAPGGVWHSVDIQASRGLQKESLGAAFLYVLDRLGFYRAHIVVGNPNWTELTGRAGDTLAFLGTLAQVGAAVLVAALVARRRAGERALVIAAAAAVAGFVAFGKVFSPQYLIWLVPLVLLAGGVLEVALLAGALVLTQLWFLDTVTPFDLDAAVWLVVLRDLLVVALFAALVERLRRERGTEPRELRSARARST